MSTDSKRATRPPYYWRSRLHFYATAYLCTAGLTNLNWFPYAIYRRGRGSFLVMYATVMSLLAVPLLHMEAILGQFTHAGNRGMLECAPAFAGLSYTAAYFYVAGTPQPCRQVHRALALRVEAAVERDRRPGIPVVIGDRVVLVPRHQFARNCTAATVSAVEHFHRDFVLRLSNHLDALHLNTDVALACAATWAIACVASCSRIGRISALMYALVIVRVFLVWFLCAKVVGVGFKGDLWKQLSSFDPAQLLDLESWRLATERSLYSMGCSRSFLRLAGWNRFFSDARCVAPILAWTNFATTLMSTTMVFLLLFLVSERTDTNLDAYFEPEEAPFVSVVQALLFLEPERSFSVLYFSLMFLTGICDLVIMQEVVMEVLVFDFPAFAERTVLAKVALCLFIYTLSLPLCSEVGPYLVNMLDINFKGTLYLLVNLAEVLVVIRVYGLRRLVIDAQTLTNATPNIALRITWSTVLPISLTALALSSLLYDSGSSYEGQIYPSWTKDLMLGLALAGFGFVPAYAIAAFVSNRWDPAMCLLPSVRWGPNRDAHVECEYVERLHQQCATRCSAGWAAKAGHAVRKTAHQASSSSTLSTPPVEDLVTVGPGTATPGAHRRRRFSGVLLPDSARWKGQATGTTHTEDKRWPLQ
ncbi:sodium- and chloride-dependent glycine transporter 1 [Rhipicephalus microplus]|uniref:sodium- and chloride-dependent glycine transporter 1 n=1 Tax=Rhipicephalus microplus TaxID=6941 RepID=UPI003F6B4FE7